MPLLGKGATVMPDTPDARPHSSPGEVEAANEYERRIAWTMADKVANVQRWLPTDDVSTARRDLASLVEQYEVVTRERDHLRGRIESRDLCTAATEARLAELVRTKEGEDFEASKAMILLTAHAAELAEQYEVATGANEVLSGHLAAAAEKISGLEEQFEMAHAALTEIAKERYGVMPDGSTPMAFAERALAQLSGSFPANTFPVVMNNTASGNAPAPDPARQERDPASEDD